MKQRDQALNTKCVQLQTNDWIERILQTVGRHTTITDSRYQSLYKIILQAILFESVQLMEMTGISGTPSFDYTTSFGEVQVSS